ncbi:hypothetical protein RCL_jg4596.t1 [Rhizophagus clarus]|uniref:RNase H type-1 domain-containing protein n=1 Tax=Rhizophagus clarus TaxID=94130 RepID=A0A8H3KWE4_9GLOM|nr:hypothetical protein RCL_jg4596.t1 [Rhizophagus clarus]
MMICREKCLTLDLIKVKGHDGVIGNKMANSLAKDGINSDNKLLNILSGYHDAISLWNGKEDTTSLHKQKQHSTQPTPGNNTSPSPTHRSLPAS